MKKIVYLVVAFAIALGFSGCGTKYYEGELRSSYMPEVINNASKDKSALIKVASGMTIWKVDRERKVNFLKMLFSGGLDSIIVEEGKHTISCSRKRDINIGSVMYKAGHEYLIDYTEVGGKKIYYWVKDLTDNIVVYGKETTKESLIKKDT